MNEELQSANEELETINDELRQRTLELNENHTFTEAILGSLGVGVVVVDAGQRVRVWNRHAEDLWGVRADEAVDQHVLGLDIGLPLDELRQPVRDVLTGAREGDTLTLTATDRRGRSIRCRVTLRPLGRPDTDRRGAVLLMERDGSP